MHAEVKMAEQFGVDGNKVPPEEFFGMLAQVVSDCVGC
jgi:hypothetical protein